MNAQLLRCAGRRLAVVAVALLASSCFDAHQVDPGILLIDNFDEGAFPADSTFMPWFCYSFNPKNQNYSCAFDDDTYDGSARSLRLDFKLTDPVGNGQDFGGAGLATHAAPGLYRDVTSFATIGFDFAMRPGVPTLPGNAHFSVHFGCSRARLTDGSAPGNVSVLQTIAYKNDTDWHEMSVSLASFSPLSLSSGGPKIQGGVPGCLQQVDDIGFDIEAELLDGQTGAGTLRIDHVYLK